MENSENFKNSINFLKIFGYNYSSTPPFFLSCYAAISTCSVLSAASLPASSFLTRFFLETCQLLALPEALLFLVPWEAPAPGLSQKLVQNKRPLQKRLLHPLPSQGNHTKASQRWSPQQEGASLCVCQTSPASSQAQQQVYAGCAGAALSNSP